LAYWRGVSLAEELWKTGSASKARLGFGGYVRSAVDERRRYRELRGFIFENLILKRHA